jgi:hypothetical protein
LEKSGLKTKKFSLEKCFRQGGRFTLLGNNFDIKVPENIYNSKGEIEATLQEYEEE